MLPEAQLWTHVMIQAMKDLEAPSLSKGSKGPTVLLGGSRPLTRTLAPSFGFVI